MITVDKYQNVSIIEIWDMMSTVDKYKNVLIIEGFKYYSNNEESKINFLI